MNSRPLSVWRVRGISFTKTAGRIEDVGAVQYGGWQASCARCGWVAWAGGQADGFDKAYAHYWRRFLEDQDAILQSAREASWYMPRLGTFPACDWLECR